MKKKIIILIGLLIIIATIVMLSLDKKPSDNNDHNTSNNIQIESTYDTKNLNWNDIVNVKIEGFDGNPSVYITYNEIPELEERLKKEKEHWEELKIEITNAQDKEKAQAFFAHTDSLLNLGNYCKLPEYESIKNGDTIQLDCDDTSLNKLGYKVSGEVKILVEGLIVDSSPNIVEGNEQVSDNLNIGTPDGVYETEMGIITVKDDVSYWDMLTTVVIQAEDLEDIELDNIESREIVLFVTQDRFEEAKKYALENNVDTIQVDEKLYTRESNFTEWEEWKGIAPME